MGYQRGSLQRHEEMKAFVLAHPEIVGVHKHQVISIETEYPLKKKKRAVAQPDVLIIYKDASAVRKKFVEIKSGSCRRSVMELEKQLRKIHNYLKWNRLKGEVVGIYGHNSMELLSLPKF
ncbi:MAG: hypothetical protein HY363_00640 [Candidatus Aenigmarchaeota archaeon]|nr:hypothetical protein [Candidatus Aenigmarchaeota archaeon]